MKNNGSWLAALALAAALAVSGRAVASDLVAYSMFPEDYPRLEAMLDAGADPNETSKRSGWSAIYAASMMQNIKGVVALIEAGANVNFADPDGITPLHLAAGYGDAEMAALLIAAGANVNAKDGHCLTPWNHTVGSGNRARRALIVNMLEQAGGQIGRRC